MVDSALQNAKEHYRNLLNNFQEGYLAANTLFDKSSDESSNLRGLLLGRDDGVGATYDELWLARLQFDVPFAMVKYDLSTAKIVKDTDKVTSALDLVDQLGVSIGVILANHLPSSHYAMFCCGQKGINKSVVRTLHNIGKSETKFLLKDVVLDYQTRKTLIHLCVQRVIQQSDVQKCKQHKVNESDAQWAYQYMQGNGNLISQINLLIS